MTFEEMLNLKASADCMSECHRDYGENCADRNKNERVKSDKARINSAEEKDGKESCHDEHLDCCVELSLVLCASTGNSSGKDLAALADELAELCGILVVDEINLVCTENANFLSSAHCGTRRTNYVLGSIIHD